MASSEDAPAGHDRGLGSALETFLRLSPDATIVVNAAGRIRAVNLRAAAMFGYDPSELSGQPIETLLPERFRAAHRGHRATYAGDPHPRLMGTDLELVGLRRDGTELSVDVSLAPLLEATPGDAHESDLVIAAVRDVTEVRRNERAAARLAALVNSVEVAVYSLTPDQVIDSWNPAARRMLGFSAEELLGRAIDVLVPVDERERTAALYSRVAAGEQLPTVDTYRLHRDGTVVPVAVTVSAIVDPQGRVAGFSEVVRDQTERLRMQADLAAARAERELLAERERIARDLHDVVIQRIFAAGMGVEGAVALLGPSSANVVARLDAVVQELDGAISDLRTSIFTLRRRPGRADGLRDALLEVGTQTAAALGFTPGLDFRGPIDLVVPSHVADHATSVVREALANVARHAQATRAQVVVTASPDQLRVEVTDDGVGIKPDGRRSGLANLRERACELGGEFAVAAAPAGGTRLLWTVPL